MLNDTARFAEQIIRHGFTIGQIPEAAGLIARGFDIKESMNNPEYVYMSEQKSLWVKGITDRWIRRCFMKDCNDAIIEESILKLYAFQELDPPAVMFADSPRAAQEKIDGLRTSNTRGNVCVIDSNQVRSSWDKLYNDQMKTLQNEFNNKMSLIISAQGPHAQGRSGGQWRDDAIGTGPSRWGEGDRWRTHPMWPMPLKDFPPHDWALSDGLGLLYFILAYKGKDPTVRPEKHRVIDFQRADILMTIHEAGAFMCWFYKGSAVVCRPPALRCEDDVDPPRLHSELGPSVRFRDGQEAYFWRGVQVPPELITAPGSVEVTDVLNESNQELRRVMMDRIGYDRVLEKVGGHTIHKDKTGELVEAQLNDDYDEQGKALPAKFCRVRDSSTDRVYLIRCDPSVKTCKEGLAQSFQITTEHYNFAKET